MTVCTQEGKKKEKERGKKTLQGLIDTRDGRGQLVLTRLTSVLCVCASVRLCAGAWGGSGGGGGGAGPSALSLDARPPSKSRTAAPAGVPNGPSRSSAGPQ